MKYKKIYLKNITKARIFQKNYKSKYGYVPSLFKGKRIFIVKPFGLKKIR